MAPNAEADALTSDCDNFSGIASSTVGAMPTVVYRRFLPKAGAICTTPPAWSNRCGGATFYSAPTQLLGSLMSRALHACSVSSIFLTFFFDGCFIVSNIT